MSIIGVHPHCIVLVTSHAAAFSIKIRILTVLLLQSRISGICRFVYFCFFKRKRSFNSCSVNTFLGICLLNWSYYKLYTYSIICTSFRMTSLTFPSFRTVRILIRKVLKVSRLSNDFLSTSTGYTIKERSALFNTRTFSGTPSASISERFPKENEDELLFVVLIVSLLLIERIPSIL